MYPWYGRYHQHHGFFYSINIECMSRGFVSNCCCCCCCNSHGNSIPPPPLPSPPFVIQHCNSISCIRDTCNDSLAQFLLHTDQQHSLYSAPVPELPVLPVCYLYVENSTLNQSSVLGIPRKFPNASSCSVAYDDDDDVGWP